MQALRSGTGPLRAHLKTPRTPPAAAYASRSRWLVVLGLWLAVGALALWLLVRPAAEAGSSSASNATVSARHPASRGQPLPAHRPGARGHRASRLPPPPAGWPTAFELGMADPPGDAGALAASGGFGIRYQYLSGGVNTDSGWQRYNPAATFVDRYVDESLASGLMPVFSYYMLLQSAPGNAQENEWDGDTANLATAATMRSYFADLETFLRHAAASAPNPVVLHVEPDLWGYLQQSSRDDDGRTVPALVSATGLPELRGLPNDAAGLAQAIVRLRNRLAPNVLLAYHLSVFGTNKDLLYEEPSTPTVDLLAARSARFYRSLHADFDLIFAEFANHNAGYGEAVLHDQGASWWRQSDYATERRYLAEVVRLTRKRVVLWQIPVGNTRMRAMDDTPSHYRDNHVQWLLASRHQRRLRSYMRAGVIALLFGPALPGDTCACDASNDGVTNPAPIDGNTRRSYSADDDGGFLRLRARLYAQRGPLRLP